MHLSRISHNLFLKTFRSYSLLIIGLKVMAKNQIGWGRLWAIADLLCMCAQLCLTVTPWTVAHQASLSMEFSRQEYWSGWPFPSPGDLPDSGIEPVALDSPVLAGRFFTTEPPGKPEPLLTEIFKRQIHHLLLSSKPKKKEREFIYHTIHHTAQQFLICSDTYNHHHSVLEHSYHLRVRHRTL